MCKITLQSYGKKHFVMWIPFPIKKKNPKEAADKLEAQVYSIKDQKNFSYLKKVLDMLHDVIHALILRFTYKKWYIKHQIHVLNAAAIKRATKLNFERKFAPFSLYPMRHLSFLRGTNSISSLIMRHYLLLMLLSLKEKIYKKDMREHVCMMTIWKAKAPKKSIFNSIRHAERSFVR